jgi:hypothetical protein
MVERLVASDAGGALAAWFVRTGAPLFGAEQEALGVALARTTAASGAVVVVGSWAEAAQFLDAAERDSRHWNAQEAAREELWTLAAERHMESDLLAALHSLQERARDALEQAASAAALRLDLTDRRFAADAVGAAQLALQHAALAALAGAESAHPFHAVLDVFASGRWPLGEMGGRAHVF